MPDTDYTRIYIYTFRELNVNRKPKNLGTKPIKAKINSFTRTKLTYFWKIRWEKGKHGLASMIFDGLIELYNKFRNDGIQRYFRDHVLPSLT